MCNLCGDSGGYICTHCVNALSGVGINRLKRSYVLALKLGKTDQAEALLSWIGAENCELAESEYECTTITEEPEFISAIIDRNVRKGLTFRPLQPRKRFKVVERIRNGETEKPERNLARKGIVRTVRDTDRGQTYRTVR